MAISMVTWFGLEPRIRRARSRPSRRGRDSRIVRVRWGHEGDLKRAVKPARIVEEFESVRIRRLGLMCEVM